MAPTCSMIDLLCHCWHNFLNDLWRSCLTSKVVTLGWKYWNETELWTRFSVKFCALSFILDRKILFHEFVEQLYLILTITVVVIQLPLINKTSAFTCNFNRTFNCRVHEISVLEKTFETKVHQGKLFLQNFKMICALIYFIYIILCLIMQC